MESKKCIRCGEIKSLERFGLQSLNKLLRVNVCKDCQNKRRTEQRRAKGVRHREEVTAYMREYRIKNRDVILKRRNMDRSNKPLLCLWRGFCRKKHTTEVNLTKGEFMTLEVPSVCPVLGIPIDYMLDVDNWPSVDRINPNLPYQLGNIAIISYRANMIKSVGNAAEHLAVASWLKQFPEFDGKKLKCSRTFGSNTLLFGRKRERI